MLGNRRLRQRQVIDDVAADAGAAAQEAQNLHPHRVPERLRQSRQLGVKNFQVVPGYDYGLRITPNSPGDYKVFCNEFCGINHHVMLGKVIVEPATAVAALAQGGAR